MVKRILTIVFSFLLLCSCNYYTNNFGYVRKKNKINFKPVSLIDIDSNSFYKLINIQYLKIDYEVKEEKKLNEYLKFYSNNKIALFKILNSANNEIDPSKAYMGYYYLKNNLINIDFYKNHIQSGNYTVNYIIIDIKKDTIIIETEGKAMSKSSRKTYLKQSINSLYKIKQPDW